MRKQTKLRKATPTLAIVADGKDEIWYLQMLKRNEPKIRVNIKPEIPNRKSLEEQYKLVCDLSKREFTKVFWLVDLDSLIKETKESPKGKQSPLKSFGEYRAKLAKKFPNVVVIVNNPCLEFWFLLHYDPTPKYFDNCSGAERELKKYLTNYEKSEEFFTKQNNDIYLKLKLKLKEALRNSAALGNFDIQNPEKAMSEMELLFQSEELKGIFYI